MKSFPIPVVSSLDLLGPGTQVEDETLDYLPMPKDMNIYRPPVLPEPEELAGLDQARSTLQSIVQLLDRAWQEGVYSRIELGLMALKDFELLNRVLGEGEASAIVQSDEAGVETRVQESVFAGVWRLMTYRDGVLIDDAVEIAPVPVIFAQTARQDIWDVMPTWRGELPPNVQNAPILIQEIADQVKTWQVGQASHVVNLSLLPVSNEDIGFLDHHLGTGRVLMLSRGYGNCRISNTRLPNCWRVVYYNSMDKVILNTVEVVDMPEVAMAAPEDLQDSHERLQEVVAWLEAA
jgi:hydrogenase-1 operon protein HyaF